MYDTDYGVSASNGGKINITGVENGSNAYSCYPVMTQDGDKYKNINMLSAAGSYKTDGNT